MGCDVEIDREALGLFPLHFTMNSYPPKPGQLTHLISWWQIQE